MTIKVAEPGGIFVKESMKFSVAMNFDFIALALFIFVQIQLSWIPQFVLFFL